MEDVEHPHKRREFLTFATVLAAASVATVPATNTYAATAPATDFTRWLDSIPGKHRILLDMREPNGGLAVAWAWVWLLTAPQAYGVPESDLGAAIVLRHNGIP